MTAGLDELKAMQAAYAALEPLDVEQRIRAVQWLIGALSVEGVELGEDPTSLGAGGAASGQAAETGTGSAPTPRDFIAQKKPTTAVERIACLAYFLGHYRKTSSFKTKDLTELNTEAAAPKFANAARDVDNADRASGYLVTAGSGAKQLTVRGDALVVALPDRAAVKQALDEHPHRRKKAGGSAKKAPAAD